MNEIRSPGDPWHTWDKKMKRDMNRIRNQALKFVYGPEPKRRKSVRKNSDNRGS
jgi:hypothetical protein